jgi:hypothetical protein
MHSLLPKLMAGLVLSLLALPRLPAQTPPPAAAVPELATLESAYAKELRDNVDAPQQAALQRLAESYRVTLETSFKQTAAQGLLTETVALQNELKRFDTEQTVPETDQPGVDPAVAKLRTAWRAEAARIAKTRDGKLQPLTASFVGNLRVLEKELTKSLKIDEAQVVRARADRLAAQTGAEAVKPPAPAVPAATAGASPGPGDLPVKPGARPATTIDLYATAVGDGTIYLNNKEALGKVTGLAPLKARLALKEGDIIAVKNVVRFSDNALYVAAVAATGEFLFETTEEWHAYIPKDPGRGWDTKNIKEERNVEPVLQGQYLGSIKRRAAMTPYYRGTAPIHNPIHEDSPPNSPSYCYHIVTRQDLLPKQLAPITPPSVALSAPVLGKIVRIKANKEGTEVVQGTDLLTLGPPDAAKSKESQFRIKKGVEPGTVLFESQAKPGTYIRHAAGKLMLRGIDGSSVFELTPPVRGEEGFSVCAQDHPDHYWTANAQGDLSQNLVSAATRVFFFEVVGGK